MSNSELLHVDNIHTYYGESHILEGVSLQVNSGETVAVLGRNGAGKTTLLRSILHLTPPRTGTVTLKGADVTGSATHEISKRGVGWIPEKRRVFSQLSVKENLKMAIPSDIDEDERLADVYERFSDLKETSEHNAGALSGGQQQMLAIGRCLVNDNDLLLVDEPTEGLAPQIVSTVGDTLRETANSKSLLLVEQNVSLAMDVADRCYVIDNGSIIGHGSVDDLDIDEVRAEVSV